MHAFGDGFGGQGLSDAGGAGEEHDDASSFSLDHVVEFVSVLHLALYERQQELFGVHWEHERVESIVIPLDFFDEVNVKVYYALSVNIQLDTIDR